jgi:hypothetical protein
MSRQWNTHNPGEEQRFCDICGAEFWTTRSVRKRCDKHVSKTFVSVEREVKCERCGVKFTTTKARKYCVTCAEKSLEGSVRKSQILRGIHELSYGPIVSADLGMQVTTAYEEIDDFSLVERDYEIEITQILHDLETHEVLYGASITEHHEPPSTISRLELAIERVKPEKVEKFRHWALETMNGGSPPDQPHRRHRRLDEIEQIWSGLPESEKERWVMGILRKERGEEH